MAFKKWFPLKMKSLDDFIEEIRKRGSKIVVEAKVIEGRKFELEHPFSGDLDDFRYSIELTARTSTGSVIIYRERNFNAERKRKAALKALVAADERLAKIREKLADIDIKTDIIGPPGKFDKESYQRLYEEAEKYNIKPL